MNKESPHLDANTRKLVDRAVVNADTFKVRDLLLTMFFSLTLWTMAGFAYELGIFWTAVPCAVLGVWSTWVAKHIFLYIEGKDT